MTMFQKFNTWLTRNTLNLLRISIGLIYVWFGALKFFDNLSPADQLAKDTMSLITFGLIPNHISIIILAIWETALGAALIAGRWKQTVFYILLLHMVCTFVPLFFFGDISFTNAPYAFTLVGQYIMKNLIIICAALVLNGYAHGKIVYKETPL